MTTRLHHGVAWLHVSPSYARLVVAPIVDIAFLGDAWWLYCPPNQPDAPCVRPFPSFDAAARLVADALRTIPCRTSP